MKRSVIIRSENDVFIYGSTVIEDDFISMYDVRDAAIFLVRKIFNVEEVNWEWGNKLSCTLGGAAAYLARFEYTSIEHFDMEYANAKVS